MKFKLKNGSGNTGRILSVEADKDDELAYVDAERVYRGDLDSFLPFTYDRGSKSYEFTYFLGAGVALDKILAAPVAPEILRRSLGSLLHMMQVCEQDGLSRLRVVLDSEYVYYDPALGMLRFVYIPIRSFVSPVGEAELISRICSATMADPSDQQFAVSVWDFVHRTTILTSVALEGFLEGWGLQTPNSGKKRSRKAHSALGADTRANHGWDFVTAMREDEARRRFDQALAEQAAAEKAAAERAAAERAAAEQAAAERAAAERAAAEQAAAQAAAAQAGSQVISQSSAQASAAQATSQAVAQAEHRAEHTAGSGVGQRSAPPAQIDRRVKLVRQSTGEAYVLRVGGYLMGRSSDCAIALTGAKSVSRKHAEIVVRPDGIFLRDLRSTNGVFVNGQRLDPGSEAAVPVGARFSLGDELFSIE